LQLAQRNTRRDEKVNVVSHDHIGVEIIVAEALAAKVDRIYNDLRDLWVSQVEMPGTGRVQIAVDLHERLPGLQFPRGRKAGDWQTPVEMPGEKQRPGLRVLVRQSPLVCGHGGRINISILWGRFTEFAKITAKKKDT
jgi:hypothetical protein